MTQPICVIRDEQKMVGYRIRTTYGSPEIADFWRAVLHDGRLDHLMKKAEPQSEHYGICAMDGGKEKLSYTVAVHYNGASVLEEDMSFMVLHGGECAVFEARTQGGADDPSSIRNVWSYIKDEWEPGPGYVLDNRRSSFEIYAGNGEICAIHIPIRKK